VTGLTGVTMLSAGYRHSLALLADGTVWSWGANGLGQLGNTIPVRSTTPVPVLGLEGVTSISSGMNHNLALLGNQTVWLWGQNQSDQLGVPNVTMSTIPVVVTH
jgi:alpha-tubulin suppressor-like RCC1 family protein